MPKYRAVKVVVRTFETFADSPEEGDAFIKKWQEGESEEPEGGIKATSYKMGWDEFNDNPEQVVDGRNVALAQFLNLMQKVIPGMPPIVESKIIHPFSLEPAVSQGKKEDARSIPPKGFMST